MKLRIRDNTLRVRLTQNEVRQWSEGVTLYYRMSCGPNSALNYSLHPYDEDKPFVQVEGSNIHIYVPLNWGKKLGHTDQIGFEYTQSWGDDLDKSLRLLIEKDFTCLKPRAGDDDKDTYAHPNAQC